MSGDPARNPAMTTSDEFEDPCLTSPTGPSFWASVRWRIGLGLVVSILTGIAFFFLSLFNARDPLDIPIVTVGSVVGVSVLWVVSRLLWAWVEWPSTSPPVRGLKAVLRYLLFDVESERRAAGSPPEPPESAG
jgi:hypothetical protein